MNQNISSTSVSTQSNKHRNLSSFLSNHNANKPNSEKKSPTHTSMKGGSYFIPDEDMSEFLELYYDCVFNKKNTEHITEKQLESGPIIVDFDFRYEGIVDRQHTDEHTKDIVYLYLEELKNIISFDQEVSFPIFVMEKRKSNQLIGDNITKDGIHVIIGISLHRSYQIMLRKNILEKIDDVFSGLPLTNSYDKIIDEGIVKGSTNWTLYGSNKPNHDAYKLTMHADVEIDKNYEFNIKFKNICDFDIAHNLHKLTARNSQWNTFSVRPNIKSIDLLLSRPIQKSHQNSLAVTIFNTDNGNEDVATLSDIINIELLNKAIDSIMSSLKSTEYYIKETHEYTQALPSKYYEPGSHELNRKVAFALKNTDNRLFLSWIMLRSNADDFDFGTIPELYNHWIKHFNVGATNKSHVTRRSIIYWVKQDATEKYNELQKSMLDYFIDVSIKSKTEFDFAVVLYQLYRDKYVCSSIVNRDWYVFDGHRWELDRGGKLRLSISKEMYDLYQDRYDDHAEKMSSISQDDANYESLKKHGQSIYLICNRLKKTSDKNNIMCEAKELFYDKHFIEKMDSNKYLMCFSNGVVDFKSKEFRDGRHTDYITKSTNNPYHELKLYEKETESIEIMHDIEKFMDQLFPIPSLCKYMWDHLSACLIGAKKENAFNIYRGSGSNGKTILTELMTVALGEYKGTLPVNYVTDKRKQIGSTSSEIIQLKGTRYVVMEEASKDTILNEGVMKDVTGGGPMQGRALFHDNETFTPQFNLVVCTNSLFEIRSDDDGTWRRIKLVDFLSKFVGKGEIYNEESPYTFPKDKSLTDKLETMAPIFISMLVKIAFETEGEVIDCEEVIEASRKYRRQQDILSCFIHDNVKACPDNVVGPRELHEAFRLWHNDIYSGRKVPKLTELDDIMTKRFGTRHNHSGKWQNVKIKYEKKQNVNELNVDGSVIFQNSNCNNSDLI